ncbi:AmpG family muropeptide MFS transporter [Proteiniphilum sp. UBA1028]|jgi:PAT family beta-lactamase induction signal transducer AmpG|uniref:AmpG family muropeptide MFS transporter n=1 Tax=Proteiniphilum sp. UBA1028 TaxID=1947251 RepID=UPI000E9CBA47|nr:AmpG family muropeptide MFS transporter [Proteiniphilum sp. UBA1028]HBG57698.1 MFS transporter [Porphyromonadaceae bacterium]
MNKQQKVTFRNPWTWIPTLYFAEGLPYVAVMTVSVIMYKRFGLSNTEIALYTSWLYLPWVIKPFWSPFVDILKTKRWWIVSMQLLIGAGLAGVAFTLPSPFYLQASLAFFWLMAFSSATHDIAADGFYMLALDDSQQSFFVGIRSTFYRFASITGQGLLVVLAGFLEKSTGRIPYAWSLTFFILAGLFLAFFVYHRFVLPYPHADTGKSARTPREVVTEFGNTFKSFFTKKGIRLAIAFMLLYRLSEAMLVKMASPFLLDSREVGGLGLSTSEVGITYGTVGVIALTLGGIIGGIVASRQGLKYWLWPMALAITLPHAAYLYLAFYQPENIFWVNAAVAVEQLGYGFGFTAYMLYLIYFSQGDHKTAHYSICTGFMALGMMLPGMAAGWIQEQLGYQHFFILIMLLTIPTLVLIPFMKVDPGFGRSKKGEPDAA